MAADRLRVALLVMCCLLAGCASVVSGTPVREAGAPPTATSAAPPALVAIGALPRLLPSLDELKGLLAAPELEVLQTGDVVSVPTPEDGGVPSVPECLAVMYPARESAYGGTGYTGLFGQRIAEKRTPSEHVVLQVVAAFPSIEQARGFFAAARDAWKGCAGKTLSTTFTAGVETFTVGQPTVTESTMTMVSPQKGGGGWACSRALGQRANVVVDVNACQNGATDQGAAIMTKTLERIPG